MGANIGLLYASKVCHRPTGEEKPWGTCIPHDRVPFLFWALQFCHLHQFLYLRPGELQNLWGLMGCEVHWLPGLSGHMVASTETVNQSSESSRGCWSGWGPWASDLLFQFCLGLFRACPCSAAETFSPQFFIQVSRHGLGHTMCCYAVTAPG